MKFRAAMGSGICTGTVRVGVAAMLCCLMVEQPLVAGGPATAGGAATSAKAAEIQGDARVLHALNRMTFGPRPGDLDAVKKMGLDRWFEGQLNPQGIDDTALETRLDAFPAMRVGQAALMEKYPNPAVIRTMVKGDLPLPSDPVEHAMYADQIAFYKLKIAGKGGDGSAAGVKAGAAKPEGGGGDGAAMTDGAAAMDGQANAMAKAEAGGQDALAAAPEEHVQALCPEEATERLLAMAPDARVRAILGMKAQELVAFRRSLSKRELTQLVAGMTPEQKETLLVLGGSLKVIGAETMQARLVRDIYSDRQLEAVMTDFWLNHFNVYVKKNQIEPYLIPSYEREVIRPRALGRFEDLLVATAKSPAMLVYLDNWRSTGPDSQAAKRGAARQARFAADKAKTPEGLNENYARELMELHTLGVGGGYTQADVTQVAKVFTGWTIERPYRGGTYDFAENRHEPGAKTVLGKTIPEGGEAEGMQVLHMLATNPATARFISTKLAVRFVSDDPPAALVDRMAQAFLASGGDMKVVLRTMFRSPEFWSPAVYRAKVKTPLEFVVSAVRASDAQVSNVQPLVGALDKLGMPLYGMQTPNGYSWKQDGWVSTGALVSRMNFALALSADRIAGVRTEWPGLLGGGGVKTVSDEAGSAAAGAAANKERRLEAVLLGEPVSARTRETVLAQFADAATKANAENGFKLNDEDGMHGASAGGSAAVRRGGGTAGPQDAQAAGMAGLLLGSPEFQRR